eukprot:scaffold1816_cov134-Isochrysis_galbana.AAC.8
MQCGRLGRRACELEEKGEVERQPRWQHATLRKLERTSALLVLWLPLAEGLAGGMSCVALSIRESRWRRFWYQICTWRGSTLKSAARRRRIAADGNRSIWYTCSKKNLAWVLIAQRGLLILAPLELRLALAAPLSSTSPPSSDGLARARLARRECAQANGTGRLRVGGAPGPAVGVCTFALAQIAAGSHCCLVVWLSPRRLLSDNACSVATSDLIWGSSEVDLDDRKSSDTCPGNSSRMRRASPRSSAALRVAFNPRRRRRKFLNSE